MNDTWVKLYRKIGDHEIIGDNNALQLFVWVLVHVNREDGTVKVGRFWLSKILKMKPSTVYKALSRLAKKYKVVTLTSNNQYTTIKLLNWSKYQSKPDEGTQKGNSEGTAREQRGNTSQEVRIKNKEEINNNEKNSDEFSELKRTLEIPEPSNKGITHEFQAEAMRIIEALGIPDKRKSAYFKVVKEEPRGRILDAYAFAQDYADPKARDGMFFWKISALKGGQSENIQANN